MAKPERARAPHRMKLCSTQECCHNAVEEIPYTSKHRKRIGENKKGDTKKKQHRKDEANNVNIKFSFRHVCLGLSKLNKAWLRSSSSLHFAAASFFFPDSSLNSRQQLGPTTNLFFSSLVLVRSLGRFLSFPLYMSALLYIYRRFFLVYGLNYTKQKNICTVACHQHRFCMFSLALKSRQVYYLLHLLYQTKNNNQFCEAFTTNGITCFSELMRMLLTRLERIKY